MSMHDYLIEEREAAKPEIHLPVIVYMHVDTQDEVEQRERIDQVRHVIQTALADDDNGLRGFVYPEVRLGPLVP